MNKEIEQAIMNARKGELLEILEKLKEAKNSAKEDQQFYERLNEVQPNVTSEKYSEYYKGAKHGLIEAILILEEYIYKK